MSFNVGPRVVSAIGGSIKRVGPYRIHTFPSELVTDGLVLNLDAGDPRSYPGSGTTWIDLSGNGNNGTFGASTAAPTYNNANGGSLVFDGTNDHISVIPINRLTTTTLDIWFNASSVSSDTSIRQYLYTQQRNPPTLAEYTFRERQGIQISGNVLQFQYLDTTNNDGNIVSISTISANTWYNLVVTLDGTTPKMYLNGTQLSVTGNLSTPKSLTVNQAFVGRRGDANGEDLFGGKIASVRDYNRALSAAEIAQNYDALKVRYTSYTNTFTPTCGGGSGKVEVLCVAGGGGGGGYAGGAGGGAGGLLYNSAFNVSSNTGIALTVGAGGTGGGYESDVDSNSGSNTSFSSLISIGGGRGGHWATNTASTGGSGGGGMGRDIGTLVLGGSGTLGQGNAGGSGLKTAVNAETSGGGGGAGGSGFNGASGIGGTGGLGLSYSISGVSQFYAGGGGGAVYSSGTSSGLGGSGVGGDATGPSGGSGKNGIPNTGSGGGGGGPLYTYGGNGSNGIVIVRYPATDYNVELLIVGGGGGGGNDVGGGGGAGGLIYYSSYPVSAGTKYSVTVGAGGSGGVSTYNVSGTSPMNGGNTIFGPLIAYGGGAGGSRRDGSVTGNLAGSGGSGGGGGYPNQTGGSGISGQGNSGGTAGSSSGPGGGGGGAGGVGIAGTTLGSAAGGAGLTYSITGTSITYAVGGNGGPQGVTQTGSTTAGSGGSGCGNSPLQPSAPSGVSGTIIIAYQGPQRGIGGTVDTTSRPGYTLHNFTTTGTDFFIP